MATNLKNKLNAKLQSPAEVAAIKEIIPVESNYVALKNNALEIISENLKHQALTYHHFDVVKSPSGGTTAFTVPGLSGDEIQKELSGIILDYTTPRAYWDTPDPVEGTPPVCHSKDSVISVDGKACATCQFNDFGSKDGGTTNAKACKEAVELLLLRPDNIMPIIVRIPVSSKILFQKYLTRLVGQMIPLNGVVTKITLEKATNKTGQPYALYNFEMSGSLDSDEAANAKTFGQKFIEFLKLDEPAEVA
jgi:hypothetical protein